MNGFKGLGLQYGRVWLVFSFFLAQLIMALPVYSAQFDELEILFTDAVPSSKGDLVFADINADGVDDLIACSVKASIMWYPGREDGTYGAGSQIFYINRHSAACNLGNLADMDGDGDLDLIAGLQSYTDSNFDIHYQQIIWLENDIGNSSSWTCHVVIETVSHAMNLVPFAGDFTGDGAVDVLYAREQFLVDSVKYTSLFLAVNQGSGNFATPTELYREPKSNGSSSSATCNLVRGEDMDGDGALDVLFTVMQSLGEGKVYLLKNKGGAAGFEDKVEITETPSAPQDISTPDMNGDGTPDILYCCKGSNSSHGFSGGVTWVPNDGFGAFDEGDAVDVVDSSIQVWRVRAGDIDNDGDMDVLACLNTGAVVNWYENTSGDAASFGEAQVVFTGDEVYAVRLYDCNKDGYLDAAMGIESDICLFTNKGTRLLIEEYGDRTVISWDPEDPEQSAVYDANPVFPVDLDNDGDLDIVANSRGQRISWYPNDGAGNFGKTSQQIIYEVEGTTSYGNLSAPADLDGDGDPDLVFLRGYYTLDGITHYNLLMWLENKLSSDEDWEAHSIKQYDSNISDVMFSTGDLNADGLIDLMIAEWRNVVVTRFLNDSANPGDFDQGTSVYTFDNPNPDYDAFLSNGFFVSDLTEDGNGDIVFEVRVRKNDAFFYDTIVVPGDGAGGFGQAIEACSTEDKPYQTLLADLNGDGALDLLFAGRNSATRVGELAYYPGDSAGSFGDKVSLLQEGQYVHSAAVGDVNNDAMPDILVTTQDNTSSHKVFLIYSGLGSFPIRTHNLFEDADERFKSCAMADLNKDDLVDFVLGGGNSVSIIGALGDISSRAASDVAQDPDHVGGANLTYSFDAASSTLAVTGSAEELPYYFPSAGGIGPAQEGYWVGVAISLPDGVTDPIIGMTANGEDYNDWLITDDGWLVYFFNPVAGSKAPAKTLEITWSPYLPNEIIVVNTANMIMPICVSGAIITSLPGYDTPLQGCTVSVQGTDISVETDSNGEFRIRGLGAGEYTLVIEMEGFAAKTIHASVVKDSVTVLDAAYLGAEVSMVAGDVDDDGRLGLDDVLGIMQIVKEN